jgi:hypothetical protein
MKVPSAAVHQSVLARVRAIDPTAYREKRDGMGTLHSRWQTTVRVDRDKLSAVKSLPGMPRWHVEAGTYPYAPAMIVYSHWSKET